MFYKTENSTLLEIEDNAFGFVYKCYIPEFGYGINSMNGKKEKTDVIQRSEIPEECYWERQKLPADYEAKRKIEAQRQKIDKLYFDPYLEQIRHREWGRRLRGVWFANYNPKTKQVEHQYITGVNYLYINNWKFQGKFMDFRIADRNLWYVVDYCAYDPDSLGVNEITKRKNGKCFGIDTKIRMFDGSVKNVQDIQNGEYVMGDDSTKRLVYGVTSGTEMMYKITANKGDGFICNESHILALEWNGIDKPNYRGWRKGDKINISVKDYIALKQWEKDHLVMYRKSWGGLFDEKDHVIPPYMLGVYLGDGSSHSGDITSIDNEIINYVKEFADNLGLKLSVTEKITYRLVQKGEKSLKDGVSMKHWSINKYRSELRKLNVLKNKHIPKEYLLDSEYNRLQLLAGLVDTDGYLDKYNGRPRKIEITQKNTLLAENITELARSLGFFTSCIDKTATMKRNDGSVYSCIVRRIEIYGDIDRIPCKIERKKSLPVNRRKNSLNFGFTIEEIGIDKYYGFAVDGNHLFLLEDGTVVHNTARVGCWLFERTSRLNNHHGGIQSKADDDAWEVFKKAVVHPWKTLPHYWRPTYDLMKGDDPNDELRFFATSRRGQSAENEEQEEALNSFIDFKSSIESAYDGPELHSYVSDEAGKTKRPVSILERQSVVRYCSEIDGEFNGKQWYTTTVEIDEGEEDNYEFQDLTAKSNPLDRDDNNRTGTGLYTYFLPAQYGMYFDKYGYADVERATIFLLNTRKKLEEDGDTRGLSSFKRKNPMSFKEAFSIDGKNSLYNPEVLNNQLDDISWKNNLTELGDLEWKDGYAFERPVVKPDGEIEYVINEIVWRPNPNGKFEKVIGWWPKEANKVYKNGVKFLPNNNYSFRIGCDPFKYDKTKDKRRSNCAAFAYQMPDDIYPDTNYDDMFTLRYAQRRDSTKLSNEDVLKMAWLCGCQVLFERNVNHWKRDFQDWNCDGFLMWLPGEVEPGIATDGKGNVVQMICNYTESYINTSVKKVFFKTLIRKDTGWLGFKVDDTQAFDEPMSAGFTLIAVKGRKYAKPTQINKDVESILPYNKAI